MSMNNITPPLPGTQTATSSNGNPSAKAEAWRKAFDKEQAEILHNTKSVKLGNAAATPSKHVDSAPAFHSSGRNAGGNPASENQRQRSQDPALSQQNTQPSAAKGTIAGRPAQLLPTPAFVLFGTQQNVPLQGATPGSTQGVAETAAAIALFESHFKQKWPLKNVHIAQADNGVHVSIRDINLSADSQEAQKLVERIRQALQTDGQTLAGLVLNGTTIL